MSVSTSWEPLWAAYRAAVNAAFPRRKVDGYPAGLMAVARVAEQHRTAAIVADLRARADRCEADAADEQSLIGGGPSNPRDHAFARRADRLRAQAQALRSAASHYESGGPLQGSK